MAQWIAHLQSIGKVLKSKLDGCENIFYLFLKNKIIFWSKLLTEPAKLHTCIFALLSVNFISFCSWFSWFITLSVFGLERFPCYWSISEISAVLAIKGIRPSHQKQPFCPTKKPSRLPEFNQIQLLRPALSLPLVHTWLRIENGRNQWQPLRAGEWEGGGGMGGGGGTRADPTHDAGG